MSEDTALDILREMVTTDWPLYSTDNYCVFCGNHRANYSASAEHDDECIWARAIRLTGGDES